MGVEVVSEQDSNDVMGGVTLIITAHNEGNLLAKTVESCRRALAESANFASTSEIIIILDRANEKTTTLSDYLLEKNIVDSVYKTNFGDPGHARNFGVNKATTEFVTFVDGDDLINGRYIRQMMMRSRLLGENVFLRPRIVVTFGNEKAFLLQFDSRLISNNEVMLYSNPWAMPVFGRKRDFLRHPFVGDEKANGFSHEDWEWNLLILDVGGEFRVVEDATYFARRRRNSRTSEAREFHYVIRPMEFFRNPNNFTQKSDETLSINLDFKKNYVGTFDAESYLAEDHFYIRDLRERKAHSALDHYMRIGKHDQVAFRKISEDSHVGKSAANATIEAMAFLSDLEGHLDPFTYWSGDVVHYDVFIDDRNTSVWKEVLETGILEQQWDVVFVLPWVRKGGADLVALKHIKACRDQGLNVCIVTTLDHELEWQDRIPDGVPVFAFGVLSKDVGPIIQQEVFHRLLIELRPKAYHNINSELFWKILERNGLSIRASSKIICSLYCQDYNFAGSSMGYDKYVDSCDAYVDEYVTDNTVYAEYLSLKLGVFREKIRVMRYPIEIGNNNALRRQYGRQKKVLWASRLDFQKGFDLLPQIAQRASDVEFHFYGEVMLGSVDFEVFNVPRNLIYRGKFSHIEEIDPDEFDCFIYTARWDGLPNIVLEMGLKGIPVISFVTGGLSDVITEETAWPVENVSVDGVLSGLKAFYSERDYGFVRASSMRALLIDAHNAEQFAEQCSELYAVSVEPVL
jgi:glycosyltransferase involved in cell wall biosynthesis